MKTSLTRIALSILLVVALVYSCKKGDSFWDTLVPETEEDPTSAQINGYIFRPALTPASDDNVSRLKVPAGFSVRKYAEQLGKPRILAISSTGTVYVSDREAGLVLMLKDNNNDGVAEVRQVAATIKQAHGLTIHNGKLYIVAVQGDLLCYD